MSPLMYTHVIMLNWITVKCNHDNKELSFTHREWWVIRTSVGQLLASQENLLPDVTPGSFSWRVSLNRGYSKQLSICGSFNRSLQQYRASLSGTQKWNSVGLNELPQEIMSISAKKWALSVFHYRIESTEVAFWSADGGQLEYQRHIVYLIVIVNCQELEGRVQGKPSVQGLRCWTTLQSEVSHEDTLQPSGDSLVVSGQEEILPWEAFCPCCKILKNFTAIPAQSSIQLGALGSSSIVNWPRAEFPFSLHTLCPFYWGNVFFSASRISPQFPHTYYPTVALVIPVVVSLSGSFGSGSSQEATLLFGNSLLYTAQW